MQAKQIKGIGYLWQIDNIFTPEQCEKLINYLDSKEYHKVTRGDMASYKRQIIVDRSLADYLFKRLKSIIPEFYKDHKLIYMNDHFRVSKYKPGEEFKMHRDGVNVDSKGNRSVLTLNIFLNDKFDGGETDFFTDDRKKVLFSCKPKAGRGALFDHNNYHCGNEVKNGYKYLIRTDVMGTIL